MVHLRISTLADAMRRLWRDRRGVSAVLFAVSGTAILGMAGLTLDVGLAMVGKNALQANTNSAALAAAQNWSAVGGSVTSAKSIATTWYKNHPVPDVTNIQSSAVTVCINSTTGLPNCSVNSPNVVKVTQTGAVAVNFLQLFGIRSFAVSAVAAASTAGGSTRPLNVMFIIDGTGSMSQFDSSGCVVPNISSPTKFQCALYGVQIVMKQLQAAQDDVGIMVFPGTAHPYIPSSPCPAFPSSVPYSATTSYQIGSIAFDNTYNDNKGNLIDMSPMVLAVGDSSVLKTGCIRNLGGQGTYYADAIQKAQSALTANGNSGLQNVIIFLSDGAATATPKQTSFSTTKECSAGVTNANSATSSGTWVYAIAYDSPTSSSSSGCPGDIPPCTAMQEIASDPTKFFSTGGSPPSCILPTSPNTYSSLSTAFLQLAHTLLQPRLVIVP
jgi:Flp pilus assembly protein TadG